MQPENQSTHSPTTIIIAGLGKEGESSYVYLSQCFPDATYILSDGLAPDELKGNWQTVFQNPAIQFVPLEELANLSLSQPTHTLICKTPGIPTENAGVARLLGQGAQLTSNTQLFFSSIESFTGVDSIVVTGTKGKSTTASLIAHILQKGERPVLFAGNIGNPPLSILDTVHTHVSQDQPPIVVLELSSHQLREAKIQPSIGVLLNVTPEHLDYYPSFEAYWQAKAAVALRQESSDILIFNPTQEIPAQIAQASQAQKVYIGEQSELVDSHGTAYQAAAWFDQNSLYCGDRVFSRAILPLQGDHNAFNSLPSLWIAAYYGLSADVVTQALSSFQPLPHRLQPAGVVNGVTYINDSQATTPEASIAALKSFAGKPITLLAGGSDKGVIFDELAQEILRQNVQTVVLFPPMGDAIKVAVEKAVANNAKQPPAFVAVTSMPEAVAQATAVTPQGGVVLLSPACASFGLFENYQDRGNQFLAAVSSL